VKLVPLAEVKNNFSHYLEETKREPVFITRNGRIAAVLEHLTDDDIEDYLLERSPKFRAALDKARRQKGGMSLTTYRKSRGV
jgi:antitoxin (DNA-binding transcriptional repressor) of toxin-antitoxin stability system